MRKIVVVNHVSLDGVMQAPGRPDEDTRGGFEHGGWAAARMDDVMGAKLAEGMAAGGPLLLGRRTYEDFYGFWPKQADNPYTDALNRAQKYVASTTLSEPLPWSNSTLLQGDVVAAVEQLKREDGPDIGILGSGALIRSLLPLIDRFLLMVHPVVMGNGQRLFPAEGPTLDLKLVDSVASTTGVTIGTYERA